MRWSRIALVGAVALAACSDSTLPTSETTFPPPPSALAISDGANGGNGNFFFLPPLVSNPSTTGTFNANLAPEVVVCELLGGVCGREMVSFGPEDISVASSSYQINWDTDGPATLPLDHRLDYRIRVLLGDREVGFMDLNPQDPNGSTPSEKVEGFYSFRLGESLPIKFWLSEGVLCEGNDNVVIECLEGVIYRTTGGFLQLEQEGVPLGVSIPAFGLPEGTDWVHLRIERLQLPDGEECLEGLDAPVYGPCFQILSYPELAEPLDIPATVAICADLTDAEFAVLQNHAQEDLLQIHRQGDTGGQIQALTNVPSFICGDAGATSGASQTSGSGLTRTASAVVTGLKSILGPTPLVAADLGLGGLTRVFSRFQWALPGMLVIEEGDGQVGNAGAAVQVAPKVRVVDANGFAVANARVHFQVTSGNGSITDPASGYTLLTDSHGTASYDAILSDVGGFSAVGSWVLGDQGTNTLRAWGNGLLGDGDSFGAHQGDPTEAVSQYDITEGEVVFTAQAAGAPASVVPTDPDQGSAEVGSTLPNPLVVTVLDDGTNSVTFLGVPGVTVTWTVTSGNGTLQGGVSTLQTVTDAQGQTSVVFTLGTLAGTNTVTATVGGLTATFNALGTAGAPAELLIVSGNGQTAFLGQALAAPLVVKAEDRYDNPIPGAAVGWSVLSGGGSVAPASATTGSDGRSSATWTLGSTVGSQAARATLGSLSADFSATGRCFTGWGTASIDGNLGSEWACANSYPFTANLGNGGVPATAYWMNDGTHLYLAVRISGADKVNSLRFDFDNDGDGVSELGDDGVNFDPATGLYTDEFLTLKCTNSSQAGCGALDASDGGSSQGAGAFTNVGGVTIYELRKPLDSADDAHDFSLSAGSTAGMFWTLRLGTGAKGNTQIPGFRTWLPFTIVAPPAP